MAMNNHRSSIWMKQQEWCMVGLYLRKVYGKHTWWSLNKLIRKVAIKTLRPPSKIQGRQLLEYIRRTDDV